MINKYLKYIAKWLPDAIFPRTCYRCGAYASYLCRGCYGRLEILPHPVCPHCSGALSNGNMPKACRRALALNRLYTIANYRDPTLNKLIKDMKYKLAYKLAIPISEFAYWWLSDKNYTKDFVARELLIVPVACHIKKTRDRGFNPAQHIARELSRLLNVPYDAQILLKTRTTKPQIELGRKDRQENLKHAFSINAKAGSAPALKGKIVLLVDDVVTTGATLRECAKVLRLEGAREIWGLAVAKD